ncbi:MAG: DUF2971 domain-containing protein [Pyrinomonadaceae bacterium]
MNDHIGDSADGSALSPRELLNKIYNEGDENVRVLYKYRSCASYYIDCLRNDTLWFSNRSQLSDPFDCLVRLAEPDCRLFDVSGVRERLANAKPYLLEFSDRGKIPEYVGNISEPEPLVLLGLSAAGLGFELLLKHLRELDIESDLWVVKLIIGARELVRFLVQHATVFCVSELNDNRLMWDHYAAGHTGFCIGYVCPVGISNPRTIDKVNYVKRVRPITDWELIDEPGDVWRGLVLTKPKEYSYEAEWRMVWAGINGLVDSLLPYREVILGARIASADETMVREAVGNSDVRFYRAVLDHTTGKFVIRIEPA